jgi:hypothetical protein
MLKDGDKRPESIAAPSIADAKPRRGHSKKIRATEPDGANSELKNLGAAGGRTDT